MSQISAPVRIAALVGLLAAVAMGAWMMTQRGPSTESVSELEATSRPIAAANAVAGRLSAHNRRTAAGKPDPTAPAARTAKPAATRPNRVKPAQTTVPHVPKRAAQLKLPKGTPTTIAGQLALHDVVVVILYDPQSKVDGYSLAEAAVGAREANAGFLRVSVLDQRQASPFTNAYGVLDDPTILFFKRPGKLALKLSGYVDHETIAQAAVNAALGLVSTQPS